MMQQGIITEQEIHKTVAHTLMTHEVIIMTIEIGVRYSDNLKNEENEVYVLPQNIGCGLNVSGVCFFTGNRFELGSLSEKVTHLFMDALNGCRPWLMVATPWKSDNRITRYYGLWKHPSFRKSGYGLRMRDADAEPLEICLTSNGECQFLGAVEVDCFDFSGIDDISLTYGFNIVFPCRDFDPRLLMRRGWTGRIYEDSEFINSAISLECCVLSWSGGFGEDVGVVVLGEKSSLDKFLLNINIPINGTWIIK